MADTQYVRISVRTRNSVEELHYEGYVDLDKLHVTIIDTFPRIKVRE